MYLWMYNTLDFEDIENLTSEDKAILSWTIFFISS